MRRVLVTGAAGFIGAHVVARLVDDGLEVVGLDALTYAADPARLAALAPQVELVQGDVRDPAVVGRLVADVDAVVHLAAETHVDRSIDAAGPFLATNVEGTGVVLEACRRAATPRLVQVSTDEVYGPIAAPHRATTTTALAPSSPYAASKASADLLVGAYRTTYRAPVAIVRPTNTYGPWQLPEKLVPTAATRLLEGRPAPVYGDGTHTRDWCHVEDTAEAIRVVLRHGRPDGTYNAGADQERRTLDVVAAVAAGAGVATDRAVEHVADRPGHDRRYAVDASDLQELGWQPTVGFEDGIARTVAWYQEHTAWWRPLVAAGIRQRRGRG